MAGERKQAVIHYRKFDRNGNPSGASLEHMVRRALNAPANPPSNGARVRDLASARIMTIGDDNYFINTYAESGPAQEPLVFGDVIHFTNGHLQALFQMVQGAPTLPVHQMPAPAQTEYVHSQMFWMVKGDHVFVIQSMSLRTDLLESYLAWLLVTTNQLQHGSQVLLAARFDEEAIGGDLNDIKEIIVGGVAAPLPEERPQQARAQQAREVSQQTNVNAGGQAGWAQARAILSTLLDGEANVSRVMSSIPEDADLHVEVHIGYKTRRRQISRTGLRHLEMGLRNLPDSQLQVRAKNTNVAADGTVRLHHNASIRLIKVRNGNNEIIGSLLDPTDVIRAMHEAYTVFVNNGKIQVNPGA